MITPFVRPKGAVSAWPRHYVGVDRRPSPLAPSSEDAILHVLIMPARLIKKRRHKPSFFNGRGDMIRTCDTLVPNQVLYQAELRPERGILYNTPA